MRRSLVFDREIGVLKRSVRQKPRVRRVLQRSRPEPDYWEVKAIPISGWYYAIPISGYISLTIYYCKGNFRA